MRRNWKIPVRDRFGNAVELCISVPRKSGGTITAWVGTTAISVEPEDASRIVAAYRAAQAQALQDRGRW